MRDAGVGDIPIASEIRLRKTMNSRRQPSRSSKKRW